MIVTVNDKELETSVFLSSCVIMTFSWEDVSLGTVVDYNKFNLRERKPEFQLLEHYRIFFWV